MLLSYEWNGCFILLSYDTHKKNTHFTQFTESWYTHDMCVSGLSNMSEIDVFFLNVEHDPVMCARWPVHTCDELIDTCVDEYIWILSLWMRHATYEWVMSHMSEACMHSHMSEACMHYRCTHLSVSMRERIHMHDITHDITRNERVPWMSELCHA